MSNGSIAGFLHDEIGISDERTLRAFDALAGKRICGARFYADIAECRASVEDSMPLFVLPVAYFSVSMGLHLRPSDVAKGRLAFIEFEDELIEVAGSIDQFVFRALAKREAFMNEGYDDPEFAPSVALANSIFGSDFYVPGQLGTGDLDEHLMVRRFGGTLLAFAGKAAAGDPAKRRRWYAEGAKLEPGCLHMHAGIARMSVELGDRGGAADAMARSLACYHHTAYVTYLDDHYELGRALLKEFPDRFSAENAWDLNERDMIKRTERVGELYHAGNIEAADKLLNDNCYDVHNYFKSVDIFRKHYEELGWRWALALCDLR
jgi:hypothetical protein